jgi:putative intracellular protease/amidase
MRGGERFAASKPNPHGVTDGLLMTGQNPVSSEEAARVLLDRLR